MTLAAGPKKELTDARILVVDDEPDLRTLYELTLLREGYRVEAAGSVQEAWHLLEHTAFAVVITDMRLPDGLGLDLLRRIKAASRAERCVVITAYGSAENAVESLKAGAFDYLTKPVDLKQFRAVIASAVRDSITTLVDLDSATTRRSASPAATQTSNAASVASAPSIPGAVALAASPGGSSGQAVLERLVGVSAVMQSVRERITKVAHSMAPVLISGESGTGKELVANALHANSHRKGGPLVAVNCSAIPENLLEAEFFGAKKGAFTGAAQDRIGFFQAAKGGTLFLDEIGDLPLAMQAKLLRAIQERCVRPLGSTQEEPVDVRIVSATHKDLGVEVQAGRFRQDLFYRLNVIDIHIPAVRQRREDLPVLCAALLTRIATESAMPVPLLAPEQIALLATHPMTGNVRELENLLHRAIALAEGGVLCLDVPVDPSLAVQPQEPQVWPARAVVSQSDGAAMAQVKLSELPLNLSMQHVTIPRNLQGFLDQQERDILIAVLHDNGFNRTAAAARLGLSLRQIRYRIARLEIELPGSNEPGADAP